MIVEFSVKNFRSVSDLQTISFVATGLSSSADNSEIDENNIFNHGKERLLKVVGLYGPNASGKTNIIRALEYFCDAIGTLPSPESQLSKLTQPFLYQAGARDTESYFQIIIMIDGQKYRYGFTVKRNNDESLDNNSQEIITNEWLFGPKRLNQGKYFLRTGLEVQESSSFRTKNIAPLEYEHTLFLTHVASYNKGICATIRNKIKGFTTTKFRIRSDFYRFHSIRLMENQKSKIRLLNFLSSFGLDYKDIFYRNDDELKKKNRFPLNRLFLVKDIFHDVEGAITLNMEDNESDGTKKLFDIAGLILHAFNLQHGGGLIILDEIDSNFHPSLLINLVKLFNDPGANKANVQLLFTSHDTNLMRPDLMRRDQFYFTEKESNESTRLYSLAELRGIRNDANFAKQYLAGFYGGLPVLSKYTEDLNTYTDGPMGN